MLWSEPVPDLSPIFTLETGWYNHPGVMGLGSVSATIDIPSISSYGTVGVVGSSSGITGGRTQVGVYGHAYFDTDLSGNASNNARGGNFLSRITSNVTDFNGSLYGSYNQADSTGGTSTGGSVYGIYAEGIGDTNNTIYGGYFNASGGTTNYSIYTNSGKALFNAAGDSSGDLEVLNNGSQSLLFVDASANRIGIGTSTPGQLLHVLNNADTNPNILVQDNSTGDATIAFNVSGDSYAFGIDNDDNDYFKVLTASESEYPKVSIPKKEKAHKIKASKLVDMIELTSFSSAKERARYALNGIFFDVKNKELRLVATDSRRLALARDTGFNNEYKLGVIVPLKGLGVLSKVGFDDNEHQSSKPAI